MNGHLFKSKKNLYTMDYDGKIILTKQIKHKTLKKDIIV